jgi:hypothetical protein
MPTTWPPPPPSVSPRLTRKALPLFTEATSIGPEKEIDSRACRLKPSSVLMMDWSARGQNSPLR